MRSPTLVLRRFLSLYEHQAKAVLQKAGLPIQRFTLHRAPDYALRSGSVREVVVKAQVLAGGRGRGWFEDCQGDGKPILKSGIHLCKNDRDTVNALLEKMLGRVLVTKQARQVCDSVMVAEAVHIVDERYIALVLDRQGVRVLVNKHGGVGIEEEADTQVFCYKAIGQKEASAVAQALDIPNARSIVERLYRAFEESDATLLEVNPLAVINDGSLVCIDAKMEVDDNALYRHPEFSCQDSPSKAAPSLGNYVELDGNVGCLVNGAGLAMATMDLLRLHGASPANFLDIGGMATVEHVHLAIEQLGRNERVRVIWVNVFGGIVRGDVVAEGILQSIKSNCRDKPIVVRLVGSRSEEGLQMLTGQQAVYTESDLDRAARMAARLAESKRPHLNCC